MLSWMVEVVVMWEVWRMLESSLEMIGTNYLLWSSIIWSMMTASCCAIQVALEAADAAYGARPAMPPAPDPPPAEAAHLDDLDADVDDAFMEAP